MHVLFEILHTSFATQQAAYLSETPILDNYCIIQISHTNWSLKMKSFFLKNFFLFDKIS